MKDQNINPREGKNYEDAAESAEGNVDGTSFGGSQNEDTDQQGDNDENGINQGLAGGNYAKNGKRLEGKDLNTDESVG